MSRPAFGRTFRPMGRAMTISTSGSPTPTYSGGLRCQIQSYSTVVIVSDSGASVTFLSYRLGPKILPPLSSLKRTGPDKIPILEV